LNIAAAPCPSFQQVVGKETLLIWPGSLCECGNYCRIDIGIHQEDTTTCIVIILRVPYLFLEGGPSAVSQFHNMNSSTHNE
jgi:hypothetical protein